MPQKFRIATSQEIRRRTKRPQPKERERRFEIEKKIVFYSQIQIFCNK